jgi:hypothetical protein
MLRPAKQLQKIKQLLITILSPILHPSIQTNWVFSNTIRAFGRPTKQTMPIEEWRVQILRAKTKDHRNTFLVNLLQLVQNTVLRSL